MKKILTFLFVITAFFTIFNTSFAVSAAPSPVCSITAKILKVENKINNYYPIVLDITEISTLEQIGDNLCNDSYINFIEKDYGFALLFSDEYKKNSISVGQEITAKVHFGGDERMGGYFLSEVKVIKDVSNEGYDVRFPSYLLLFVIVILSGIVIIFLILKKTKIFKK